METDREILDRVIKASKEVLRTYPSLCVLYGQEMIDAIGAGNELVEAIKEAELHNNH
jgi:hypothetical protein